MSSPVRLLGLPTDRNASYRRGAAGAPRAVRELIATGMGNLVAENGMDLADPDLLEDRGDVDLREDEEDLERIREASAALWSEGPAIFLGGDHFVTWPVLEGFRAAGRPAPHLVQIDAHPDLYPDFEGNPHSHASPMARILERELAVSLTQVGIRTANGIQRSQIERYGVSVFPPWDPPPGAADLPRGPTYVTLDLDALDPAFAPGVSHHEPGGLSVRDVIELLGRLPGPIVGGDIVEYNPTRDHHERTAAVAVKLLKELAARMMEAVVETGSSGSRE